MKPNPLMSLATSRKVIVTLAALIACVVLVALGKLETSQFVTVLAALTGVLTAAIALEDHGKNQPPQNVNVGGDLTQNVSPAQATPEASPTRPGLPAAALDEINRKKDT